jgi:GNAT superfamily N-acetyltransferase
MREGAASGDPLSAFDRNRLEANRIFMGLSDTGEYVEERDVAIASCGLPVEALNWGFLKPPYDAPLATAATVRSYFDRRRLPFRLAFRAEARRELAELECAGWRHEADPTPGMALAIPVAFPEAPEALSIRQVRTSDEMVAFREAAFRGFGYPVPAARLFINERFLSLPRVRLHAGFVGDEVVATSILIATDAVAGIYWVATLEEQRGRGYGAALTWAAVAGGRELGCRVASLQASKMGCPVYARMGFEHVLDYEYLHPPEA